MTEGRNRQWLLQSRPTAALTGSEFRLSEGPIPQPADGQVLVRNLWLSFDPTQRGWMSRDTYIPMVPLGEVMRAAGVGQVIEVAPSRFQAGGPRAWGIRMAGLRRDRWPRLHGAAQAAARRAA